MGQICGPSSASTGEELQGIHFLIILFPARIVSLLCLLHLSLLFACTVTIFESNLKTYFYNKASIFYRKRRKELCSLPKSFTGELLLIHSASSTRAFNTLALGFFVKVTNGDPSYTPCSMKCHRDE